ncbi:MAG: N-acetylmuramoyl-L-alanine amidase [Deinococcales bacterium]
MNQGLGREFCLKTWLLILLSLFNLGLAQQCLNYVTVNQRPLGQVACYFIAEGDRSNAFIDVTLLARELGVFASFDAERNILYLRRARDEVQMLISHDIHSALTKRAGVMAFNGQNIDSMMGVLSQNTIYVPLSPVVSAFSGSSLWDASVQTIQVMTTLLATTSINTDSSPTASPNNSVTDSVSSSGSSVRDPVTSPAIGTTNPNNNNIASLPSPREALNSIEAQLSTMIASTPEAQNTSESSTSSNTPESLSNAQNVAATPNLDSSGPALTEGATESTVATASPPLPTTTNTTTSPAVAAFNPPINPSPTPTPPSIIQRIGQPRVGKHDTYSRVALDLPVGSQYQIVVKGNSFIVKLPGFEAFDFSYVDDDPFLSDISYELIDNVLSLVVTTKYLMSNDGYGYRVGTVAAGPSRPMQVLYIDFGTSIYGNSPTGNQNPDAPQDQLTGPTSTDASTGTLETQASLPANHLASSLTDNPTVNASTTPAPSNSSLTATPSTNNSARVQQVAENPERTVVIDPGHGGWDPGAQGYVSEETVVLDIALKLRTLLEQEGIHVLLTRDGDYSLADSKRADLAARADLANVKRNLFISIHANSSPFPSAQGIETWVFGKPLDPSLLEAAIDENGGGDIGEALTREAQNIYQEVLSDILREEQLRYSRTLAQSVQRHMINSSQATDRGIKENYFYVIQNAQIPAVLVEVGFVSHAQEGRKLATDEYRQELAEAIADGIMEFFNQGLALNLANNP